MKNTAINALEYTGIVTLSQYIGSKKVKIAQVQNSGAYSLFNFLSDCLLGDFEVAAFNRPTKIMLLNTVKTDENGEAVNPYYESRSNFIYLLSKPEKIYNSSKGTVRYSFVVARDLLEGTTFNSIGLYADSADQGSPDNFAAVVNVSLNAQSLVTSSALVIDWELNISNKDKETL